MKTGICSSLLLGMMGSMLAACGGGSGSGSNSTDSLSTSDKQLVRSEKAASCVAWTSGGSYTAGEVVTYNGSTYTALVTQTDYAGTGWNPTVGSLYKAGGTCSGAPAPAPSPSPSPSPSPTPSPSPGCTYSTWSAGINYPKGTVVKYPANGNYYLEVNNGTNGSDGTDPTISTWYWQPTTCSGSSPAPTPTPTPTPSPSCTYSTWSAGVDYYKGTVVKYPANGNYYLEVNNGTNGSDGTDPTISTWYWQPTTCSGGGTTPTPTPASGFPVTQAQFSAMFPNANGFYTYSNLVSAINAKYPSFANTGSTTQKLQEAAAFFANVSHETSGLVYINEIAQAVYCGGGSYACAPGQEYYGRGPLQISWNYNYGAAGAALGVDLTDNPGLVATDGTITWETALWFWMTQTGNAGVTPHNSMVNGPNFGQTINAINGGIECGQAAGSVGNQEMQDRVSLYSKFAGMLGVPTGSNTGC